jgi:Ca-activated chloride channel family protein
MTEDELKALKDMPAPPPRAGAKAAALAAAMAAFDDAGKNIAEPTQGKEAAPRPMHASHEHRRQNMRAPILYKIAAGIAFILVATPTAVYFVENGTLSSPPREAVPSEAPVVPEGEFPTGRKLVFERLGGNATGSDSLPPPQVQNSPAQTGQSGIVGPGGRTLEERIQGALRDAAREKGEATTSNSASPDPSPTAPAEPVQPNSSPDPAGQSQTAIAPPPPADRDESVLSQRGQTKADAKIAAAEPKLKQEAEPPSPDKTRPARPQSSAVVATPATELGVAGRIAPSAAPQPGRQADMRRVDDQPIAAPAEENRDKFEAPASNPVKQVAAEPVSTFSIDVDTASYAFMRRALNGGRLPPKDSVRVEELINYFPYDYPRPETAETPFQPTVTVVPAPWKPANKLVHIAIKGYDVTPAERPRANIVLLIDQSGSMSSADRLPLVKNAFRLLIDELKPEDTVGIVTYASGSGIALEPTKVSEKRKIVAAIDRLQAGGSTAGAAGINDAYRLAEEHFDKEGVNRIILATDGDFNVGISNQDELKGFIERKRAAGVFLSILGVGQGNYHDSLMQTLAQNGNGTAAYVDTLNEARKVLVDEASSTLFTIAKDVKIQMEFNPAAVSEYRLIGYETRALRREDFNNDKVDAGEIGSGHTVTAIYEVTPVGAPKLVDDLRYGQPGAAAPEPATPPATAPGQSGELGFLKLRYKLPKEDVSKLISIAVTPALEKADIAAAPEDVRFSVAVAGFGQILRGLPYVGGYGYDEVRALAQGARGPDPFGYRAEFINLVRLAKSAKP